MKTKKSLLVVPAIALVFALAFTTCSNGGGGGGGGNQAGYDGTPGLAFELIDDNTGRATLNGKAYRVRKGDIKDGHVKIPAYYNGLPVTEIGSTWDPIEGGAFNNAAITSIEIPETVTTIGAGAFFTCDNLTSIIIPASVTEMGNTPFNTCYNLKNITVAADNPNYSSEDGILFNKNKTELIDYPSASGSVTIPDGVATIRSGALSQCQNLTSVTIPASVTYIGGYGTDYDGWGAFYNSWYLENIDVALGNPNYSSQNGILYNKAKTTFIQVPMAISGNVIIPEGITSIGENEFFNRKSLTGITIPEGVTSIGSSAFAVCYNLTSITIPESVTSIGKAAFQNCFEINNIIIPDSVTKVGSGAFGFWNSFPQQTICVKGHANQAAADTAWGADWRKEPTPTGDGDLNYEKMVDIFAAIKYWNGSSYQ